ncbi:MAG: helix-turn-helix transcriptional regulator [Leptolyngbyaceae cyanobacterium SU_3_3]|nr:helix-turn-helix transcriptional regulator [Leptolyngbyaceae cyanobacterium SU_3_3]
MTKSTRILSEQEYRQLWQRDRQFLESSFEDVVYQCPTELGSGYDRWIELPEIDLLLIQKTFHQGLSVEYDETVTSNEIEFGFNLSGEYSGRSGKLNFLDWTTEGEVSEADVSHISGQVPIQKVDIHLKSSDLLQRFLPDDLSQFPSEFCQPVSPTHSATYSASGTITASMKLAIDQIFNCPFQGLTKRIYLESKCLELIALKLDQLSEAQPSSPSPKSDERDRIHQARDILMQRVACPPSLIELAHQVGLNDRKLKQGFQAVFGTTVFGYLYEYRMQQAAQLLMNKQISVDQVAHRIGYASRGAFYKAFKKKFGINPRNHL